MISRIMIPMDQRSQNGEELGFVLNWRKPIDEYGARTSTFREAVEFLWQEAEMSENTTLSNFVE